MLRGVIFSALLVGVFCSQSSAFQNKNRIVSSSDTIKREWAAGKSIRFLVEAKFNRRQDKKKYKYTGHASRVVYQEDPTYIISSSQITISPKIEFVDSCFFVVEIKNLPGPGTYDGDIDFLFSPIGKVSYPLKLLMSPPKPVASIKDGKAAAFHIDLDSFSDQTPGLFVEGQLVADDITPQDLELTFALRDDESGEYIDTKLWSASYKDHNAGGINYELGKFPLTAGTYEGKAHLKHANHGSIHDFDLKVTVQDKLDYALLAIALGVIIGRFIRLFTKKNQPIRLELGEWINELMNEPLADDTDKEELSLIRVELGVLRNFEALEDRISKIDIRIRVRKRTQELIRPAPTDDAALWAEDFEKKVSKIDLTEKKWFGKVQEHFNDHSGAVINTGTDEAKQFCKATDITQDKVITERTREPFKSFYNTRLIVNAITGIEIPRYSKFWGFRLTAYLLVLAMFIVWALQERYYANATYGANGFVDHFEVLLWATGGNAALKNVFSFIS